MAKLWRRPAAPKAATASCPSSAISAVSTERPIGLIAFENDAGPATRMIARIGSRGFSHWRMSAGLNGRCVLPTQMTASTTATAQPISVAHAAPAMPIPSNPKAPVIMIGSSTQFTAA